MKSLNCCRNIIRSSGLVLSVLFVVAALATLNVASSFATGGGTPQASITLTNCSSGLCNANNTDWTLDKTPHSQTLTGNNTITWTVTATKGATTDNFITANGVITVTNTGTANATIGNIVVNLQKPRTGPNTGACRNVPWVSAAANVANAFKGDAATSAKIVAAASSEVAGCNAGQGPSNYTVSSAQGTFTETAGSGTLEFTDASNNTIFSLTPQKTLAPGASITLLYTATFDNTTLGLAAGTQVRAEALVSFGNAGGRGGSGSSATNIDINGNGTIDPDEANVRTVPCRVTSNIPTLQNVNSTVTLSDIFLDDISIDPMTGSNVALSNFLTDIGGGSSCSGGTGTEDITATATRCASIDDVCTPPGAATITNTAHLDGDSLSVVVQGPIDPNTGLPTPYTFFCVQAVSLDAPANADVTCEEELPPPLPPACTYTKGGYAGPGAPGQLFNNNFTTVFPSGLTIGIDSASNPPYDATWTIAGQVQQHPTIICTGLKCYLSTQDGTPGQLTADTTDATSTAGGVLPAQVATLTLNIGFDDAGILPNGSQGFKNLQLCNFAAGSNTIGSFTLTLTTAQAATLNTESVSQVLAETNTAIAGNGLPSYVNSFGDLNQLVTALNESFDNCVASAFANAYLCAPTQ